MYDYTSKKVLKKNLIEHIKELESLGAGEILVNSVNNDGKYCGYDIDLFKTIYSNVTIPIIACGGAKNAFDFIKLFSKTKVAAACAGNFFHFQEHSVNISKSISLNKIRNLRLETHAKYNDIKYDKNAKILKKNDKYLENMLFEKIEKEII